MSDKGAGLRRKVQCVGDWDTYNIFELPLCSPATRHGSCNHISHYWLSFLIEGSSRKDVFSTPSALTGGSAHS